MRLVTPAPRDRADALGIDAIPGSRIDHTQDLRVR
jgi:hypothetical protein